MVPHGRYVLWRHHDYEYELDRIPIDVINGGPAASGHWVDKMATRHVRRLRTVVSTADAARWARGARAALLYSWRPDPGLEYRRLCDSQRRPMTNAYKMAVLAGDADRAPE
ncbi:MAG: hypothetical protein U5O39_16745 [Gammaproteobacteria bacterium]|nr:hypothetical protein [Gammaproteobacteria bacterium]